MPKNLTQREKLSVIRAAGNRGRRAGALASARFVGDQSREVRLRALESLCENGDEKFAPFAIAALADAEDTVVVTALQCLVSWELRRYVDKVVPLLDSPSELIRAYAAWSLGRLGARRHAPILRKRLRLLDDEVERSAVAEALYTLTLEPRYLRHLLNQLGSADPEARAFTTNSLVGVADRRNFGVIVCALARALATETSEAVLPSIRRDLAEVVSLAIEWSAGAGPD
jgi:HEAT repeat protein